MTEYYYCKYCGKKAPTISMLTSLRCESGSHKGYNCVPYEDNEKSTYYCQYCGKKAPTILSLTSLRCESGSHKGYNCVPYEGNEKSTYYCQYCGKKAPTILSLTSLRCESGSNKGYNCVPSISAGIPLKKAAQQSYSSSSKSISSNDNGSSSVPLGKIIGSLGFVIGIIVVFFELLTTQGLRLFGLIVILLIGLFILRRRIHLIMLKMHVAYLKRKNKKYREQNEYYDESDEDEAYDNDYDSNNENNEDDWEDGGEEENDDDENGIKITVSDKNWWVTFFLCLFLGILGIHRFYAGRIISGILMLLTLGGFGIWILIDLILLLKEDFKDVDNGYIFR